MDTLNLSYREVVREVPYPVLLLMMFDKLTPLYGEQPEKLTGKEMLKRKRKGNN